jgi:hypothetical protein
LNALAETADGDGGAMSSFAETWRLFRGRPAALLDLILALGLPSDGGAGDMAVADYAERIGCFAAEIVALPAGAAAGADQTWPLAPQFRFACYNNIARAWEAGAEPAIILPVQHVSGACAIGFDPRDGEAAIADAVSDFIALRANKRALSHGGLTSALCDGEFPADDQGRAVIFATGRAWLDYTLVLVRGLVGEFARNAAPSDVSDAELAAQGGGNPAARAALLLEPEAFDWSGVLAPIRPYALPEHAKQLCVPDSAGLAEFLCAAMKQPARRVPRPTILAPKGK